MRCVLLCLGLVAVLTPRPADLRRFEFTEAVMGTRFRVVLYAADEAAAQKAWEAALARARFLDDTMTDYRDSELMRLSAQAGGPPMPVSPELFAVLAKSQEIARRSDGAFDVTVRPLVQLWRRARRQKELPAPEKLAAAKALVDYRNLVLDEKARTAQLLKKGMQIDLGGIAKGYAGDEVQKVLKAHGIRQALVAFGGDVVVSAAPPGAKGWTVGVLSLEGADKPAAYTLLVTDAGVSTCGDAEQYVEIGGVRYSHVVDPKTGLGLTGHGSATVAAADGITADGLDTAALILGPEKGRALIEATPGATGLIQLLTPAGAKVWETRGWAARAVNAQRKEPGRE